MKPADVEHIYYDGRHYDQTYRDRIEDIPFWINRVREYGDPCLELACGTGRIAIALAKEGFRVTGLDVAGSMLAEARKKSANAGVDVELVEADVRDFELGRRFPLIIFPFNSLCHLVDLQDLEGCLLYVRRHLEPEGRFIVDVFNPRLDLLLRDPREKRICGRYSDPDGKGPVVVRESNSYDRISQTNRIRWFYKLPGRRNPLVEHLDMRIYFPRELNALLYYNGFTVDKRFGDYDDGSFTSESPKQLLVCVKQDDP